MRTTSTVLCLALALTTTSAQALSCMAPSLAHSYAQAHDSEARFHLALGTLSIPADFTPPPPPKDINQPTPYSVLAQFTGHFGTRTGFGHAHSGPVTINVTCLGPWCGGLPGDHPQIMFLEVTQDGHTLNIGPCPGSTHPASAENRAIARDCLAGNCPEPTY